MCAGEYAREYSYIVNIVVKSLVLKYQMVTDIVTDESIWVPFRPSII